MNYCIFSIDDSRKHYTDKIRAVMSAACWEETPVRSVNGKHEAEREYFRHAVHPYKINANLRVGQLGIWYTVLNALEQAPILTFEDDALINPQDFADRIDEVLLTLPEDTDFFSLFLPRDSDHLFNEGMLVTSKITRTYQRYGGVSMIHTKQGADKIRALLERDGITGQYDDVLYEYSRRGELNGYCLSPKEPDLVYISGLEESIVQNTEFLE